MPGKTIGELMEEMRIKAGAKEYHGHSYLYYRSYFIALCILYDFTNCFTDYSIHRLGIIFLYFIYET